MKHCVLWNEKFDSDSDKMQIENSAVGIQWNSNEQEQADFRIISGYWK
jgi:hypothetical protein